MVKEIILMELNKRIEQRNKELEDKGRIYDERLKQLQEIENAIQSQDKQTKELEKKLDVLLEKEKQLFVKNYIIKTEDKQYDLARKDEITFIEDRNMLTKEILDVLED